MGAHKTAGTRYEKSLTKLVAALHKETLAIVAPLLRKHQAEYLGDSYTSSLEEAFEELRKSYADIDAFAQATAAAFVTAADDAHARKFRAATESVMGVDLGRAVRVEGLTEALEARTAVNVKLITRLPEDYLNRVETIVFTGVTQGSTAGSMIEQLEALDASLIGRAELIARDQTSKFNGELNQRRQTALGITEYIWRTAGDFRVRPVDARNNGHTYRWNKPPAGGHPGAKVGCRCIAQAIVPIS